MGVAVPATVGRVTRVFAAVAVLTGFAAVVAAPAQADPTVEPYRAVASATTRANKPARAVRSDRTAFRLGSTGPAFQPTMGARVVGGSTVDASQHPSVVGLWSVWYEPDGAGGYDSWVATCTGTVISRTKVLTAAHCAIDLPLGSTYVIAGRSVLSDETGGFVTRPASVYTHQQHADDQVPVNDVSVLTLKDPLPVAYTPIALAGQGDESWYADGTPAQVVGYGVSSSALGDSGTLRAAALPIVSDSACAAGLGPPYRSATMACAGNPQAGIDTCGGDSGGPLIVTRGGVRTQVGITSWGPNPCGVGYGAYTQVSAYSDLIRADLPRRAPNNLDWTGDGQSDLIGRTPSGALYLYSGTGLAIPGHPAFSGNVALIGSGWQTFRKVFRVDNWNLDGSPSIMAVAPNGNLLQYRSDGRGQFTGQAIPIGTGWTMFNDIMVTANWTGNGKPNLLGRLPNGDLYLYTSNGAGGWENGGVGIRIGVGWGMFNTILTPGEWRGAGRPALIGRTPGGDLRLYEGDGHGGWVNGWGEKIGVGWNMFTTFMAPGDVNGDNRVDLIGITPGGEMRLYRSDGAGNWITGAGEHIGGGWNMFTTVF